MKVLGGLTVIVLIYLFLTGHYATLTETFTKGLFQVVSIGTTTGFTTDNFVSWPGALPVLLILSSFVGGCAGSTGGGMKVIRWLLMYKQGWREVQRLVHPSAAITVKLGDKAVHHRVVDAVWGYFAVYVVVFGILMLVLLASGADQVTAFSSIAASRSITLARGWVRLRPATAISMRSANGRWSAPCSWAASRSLPYSS